MRVYNVHSRLVRASPEAVGRLLDGLASANDRLWPRDRWPAMRLDRPLGVGAAGGHGPVRYTVDRYVPGLFVRFRFTAPRGFVGAHRFEVEELPASAGGGTRLWHVLHIEAVGRARLTWPLFYGPLHDALVEDAFDRTALALGEAPAAAPPGWMVRLLRVPVVVGRRLAARRRARRALRAIPT